MINSIIIVVLFLFPDKAHLISIDNLILPPKKRQIREVDTTFLEQLIKNMSEQPSGNYEALFVLAKGITKKDQFELEKINEYKYEVLGGTHVVLATKHLREKFPHDANYSGRVARIYVGLNDEEALWLGAMHNQTGAFRHELTYRNEVRSKFVYCEMCQMLKTILSFFFEFLDFFFQITIIIINHYKYII